MLNTKKIILPEYHQNLLKTWQSTEKPSMEALSELADVYFERNYLERAMVDLRAKTDIPLDDLTNKKLDGLIAAKKRYYPPAKNQLGGEVAEFTESAGLSGAKKYWTEKDLLKTQYNEADHIALMASLNWPEIPYKSFIDFSLQKIGARMATSFENKGAIGEPVKQATKGFEDAAAHKVFDVYA